MPPSGWMNDPNGTVFHNGYYHLFYQHNPYTDYWHDLHWGHARSRDLVTWEQLPIALFPLSESGEQSIYSGSCELDADASPMLFYTRVDIDAEHPREQCAAISDDDMITWSRHPENPIVTIDSGCPPVKPNWRDPYVFQTDGRYFMVVSAQLTEEAGGDFVILLFKARDGSLAKWEYSNILLQKPDYTLSFFECPNFFPVENDWVLLSSPFKPVEYYVGSFDPSTCRFTPRTHGVLDNGIDYYATNTATAPDGRTIVFAWIRGFRKGKGWNGCLALPREIVVNENGVPVVQAVREVLELRGESVEATDQTITEKEIVLSQGMVLSSAEIECTFELGSAASVDISLLRSPDGRTGVNIVYDGDSLDVHGTKIVAPPVSPEGSMTLRIFVDRSVLEVFINGGQSAVTKVVYPGDVGSGISIRSHGGTATLHRFRAWRMKDSPALPEYGIDFELDSNVAEE